MTFISAVSLLGGFMALIVRLTGICLKKYQKFAVRTSMIKNLYYYSRTKKKEDGIKFSKAKSKLFK
jgi:Tfp pilus assembly major pilin PilA